MVTVPPSMHEIAQLCLHAALHINQIARQCPATPTADIASFDSTWGDADVQDPLMTSHRFVSMYLAGAGDLLYGIGKVIEMEDHLVLSPSALSRSVLEYASRAWWLASSASRDEMVARMAALFQSGYQELTMEFNSFPGGIELGNSFSRWRSRHGGLPRQKLPKMANLIEAMIPGDGGTLYGGLSQRVHGNAIQVLLSTQSASKGSSAHVSDVRSDSLSAVYAVILAGRYACELWDIDSADIESCGKRYNELRAAHVGT